MRRALLAVLLVAALWQGVTAVRWIRYDVNCVSARSLDAEGRYGEALALVEAAVPFRPGGTRARIWVGDVALHLLENDPAERTPEAERALLDRAWAGYAGVVLVAPLDTWSWGGLAEAAVSFARLKDSVDGVSLDTLDARGRGILDPWRAIALGAAQLAVSTKPSGYQEIDVLADVYESSGDVERAAATYVRAARVMPAPSFHAWGEGRTFAPPIYKQLLKGLEEGIEASPPYDRSLLHLEVARFARLQGDPATAIVQSRLAESTAHNAYQTHHAAMEVGQVLAEEHPDEALAAWRRAAATGYDPGIVAKNIAVLELRIGQPGEACGHFADALRYEPSDVALRIQGAAACEQAREIDTAEQILRDGVISPSESLPVAEALIAFLVRVDRRHTARALLNTWIEDDPGRVEYRRWLQSVSEVPAAPPDTADPPPVVAPPPR